MEELDAKEEEIAREIEALQEFLYTPRVPRTMTQGATPESSAPSEATQPRDLATELEEEAQAAAPAPANAGGIHLTEEQFQQLLANANSNREPVKKLLAPRVGGLAKHKGVWTGHGRNEEGLEPVSLSCYREFPSDGLKAMQAIHNNEELCKQGLRVSTKVLFCRDDEEYGGKGAMVLKELDQYLMQHGMEAVFQIQTGDGTLDMLKTPGLLTDEIVTKWIDDLTLDGVMSLTRFSREPICPYDKINLQLSADAILNSCSDILRQDLLDTITPKKRYGPWVLMEGPQEGLQAGPQQDETPSQAIGVS